MTLGETYETYTISYTTYGQIIVSVTTTGHILVLKRRGERSQNCVVGSRGLLAFCSRAPAF